MLRLRLVGAQKCGFTVAGLLGLADRQLHRLFIGYLGLILVVMLTQGR